jgi:hypothetical protein
VKETSSTEKDAMHTSKMADHDYFVVPNVTDLAKIRDEAYRRTQHAQPESSLIHHHRLIDKCHWATKVYSPEGTIQKHEMFGEWK